MLNSMKKGIPFIALIILSFLTTSVFAEGGKDKKDIVTIAVESGNFKTLVKALKAANLAETLKDKGPFTVFAPTDEAFAKLPEGTLESLLKDKDALTKILLYHVVAGKVTSSEVVKMKKAETLAKVDVKISANDDGVMINDSKVNAVDIYASNGVIHVVDNVLIPKE